MPADVLPTNAVNPATSISVVVLDAVCTAVLVIASTAPKVVSRVVPTVISAVVPAVLGLRVFSAPVPVLVPAWVEVGAASAVLALVWLTVVATAVVVELPVVAHPRARPCWWE